LEPENSFVGKNYDEGLLGSWEMYSIQKDEYNSITSIRDVVLFQQGNIGKWEIFHFGVLEDQYDFFFHTELDTLHFQFVSSIQSRKYLINSDTLTMTSPIPDSLHYLDAKHFTIKFLKTH
jgi:hypothetical protein